MGVALPLFAGRRRLGRLVGGCVIEGGRVKRRLRMLRSLLSASAVIRGLWLTATAAMSTSLTFSTAVWSVRRRCRRMACVAGRTLTGL